MNRHFERIVKKPRLTTAQQIHVSIVPVKKALLKVAGSVSMILVGKRPLRTLA